jgi:hypothetical protein
MVIALQPVKKPDKPLTESEIEQMINSGGITTQKQYQDDTKKEVKFTVRLPKNIVNRIDKIRSKRAAKPSRNNWILDVIERALEESEKNQ